MLWCPSNGHLFYDKFCKVAKYMFKSSGSWLLCVLCMGFILLLLLFFLLQCIKKFCSIMDLSDFSFSALLFFFLSQLSSSKLFSFTSVWRWVNLQFSNNVSLTIYAELRVLRSSIIFVKDELPLYDYVIYHRLVSLVDKFCNCI